MREGTLQLMETRGDEEHGVPQLKEPTKIQYIEGPMKGGPFHFFIHEGMFLVPAHTSIVTGKKGNYFRTRNSLYELREA